MSDKHTHTVINEILPKAGLVYSEKGNLSEILCKPKIMPLKSATLQKLETAERNLEEATRKDKNSSWTREDLQQPTGGGGGGQRGPTVTSEVMSFD
ncbi:unnamed protein product [Amoebophrya sp. A120]|nr:unnamed protein product [Amoebophrya sp. A120]|eukprot:GSA120T00024654001.1